MSIQYDTVVPWGRSYNEYLEMFNLTDTDLEKKILGVGDGPASFNSVMAQNKKKIVSIDPLYLFTAREIDSRIEATYDKVLEQTRKNQDKFHWNKIKNLDHLAHVRMSAMKDFLFDYEKGRKENRYIPGELPQLPFNDKEFDLVLCAHLLFFYSDKFNLDFHLQAVAELCRVGSEVQIFPLVNVNAELSPYVERVKEEFMNIVQSIEEVPVKYEFQINGNKMLRIVC